MRKNKLYYRERKSTHKQPSRHPFPFPSFHKLRMCLFPPQPFFPTPSQFHPVAISTQRRTRNEGERGEEKNSLIRCRKGSKLISVCIKYIVAQNTVNKQASKLPLSIDDPTVNFTHLNSQHQLLLSHYLALYFAVNYNMRRWRFAEVTNTPPSSLPRIFEASSPAFYSNTSLYHNQVEPASGPLLPALPFFRLHHAEIRTKTAVALHLLASSHPIQGLIRKVKQVDPTLFLALPPALGWMEARKLILFVVGGLEAGKVSELGTELGVGFVEGSGRRNRLVCYLVLDGTTSRLTRGGLVGQLH